MARPVPWDVVLVLSLDTSTAAVTVALVDLPVDGPLLPRASRTTITAHSHGELLSPLIGECLTEAGAAPADVDAVVAGTGPGPFTGLRVGLVTAAAFADAVGAPTYGVCSLDGMAHAALGELLVANDARRHEVYWARYCDGIRTHGPEVDRPADVPTDGATSMTGAGARLYADVLGLPLLDLDHPEPIVLVEVARERIRAHTPSEALVPLYLRRPDAVPPAAPKAVSQ